MAKKPADMTDKQLSDAIDDAALVTVYHPDLDRSRKVSKANVERWTAQGWRKTPRPKK